MIIFSKKNFVIELEFFYFPNINYIKFNKKLFINFKKVFDNILI